MDLIIKIIIIVFCVIILLTIIYFIIKDDKFPPENKKNIHKKKYPSKGASNSDEDKYEKSNKRKNFGNNHENENQSYIKEMKYNLDHISSYDKIKSDNFHEIKPIGSLMNEQSKINYLQEPITKPYFSENVLRTESSITEKESIEKPSTFNKNLSRINNTNEQNSDNQLEEIIYNLFPFVSNEHLDDDSLSKQTNIRKKPLSWIYKRVKTEDEEHLKKIFLQKPQYMDIYNHQEFMSILKSNSFFSYIKNKSQIDFNLNVWLPFKSKTIKELRNKLYTILKNKNIEKFNTNSMELSSDSNEKGINTLSMNNNTCYLISIIYMIKTNKQLLKFITKNCNDEIYKKTLLDYFKKSERHCITKEEFNILVDYSNWGFEFNGQDDPNMFLQSLLHNKCDVPKLQFAFLGNLLISKSGVIINDKIYNTQEITHYSTSSFGLTFPVLELFMNKPGFNYNIKDILLGTKANILTYSQKNLYLMPIFTTAPPFLCIKIVPGPYNTEDSEDFPVYENGNFVETVKYPIYKFHKHGNLVFQNEIYLRSLLDKESKYKLTGFLVYMLYKSPNKLSGHYIPYFKIGNKWTCNYFDIRKDVTDEIKFPLNMEDNERFIVSSLFYERLT